MSHICISTERDPRTPIRLPCAISSDAARKIIVAPDRTTVEGARDHALMLAVMRAGLRVTELLALRARDANSKTLPADVRDAIFDYLQLDGRRRRNLKSDGLDSPLFQPVVNFRTLVFDRALSRRHVERIVGKWGDYAGAGKVTPRMLRGALLDFPPQMREENAQEG